MPNIRRRLSVARAMFAVVSAVMLSACAIQIEPAHDPRIVAELEALAIDTQSLFADGQGFAHEALPEREDAYSQLVARASAIRLLAEARPAPASPISDRIRSLTEPAEDSVVELIGRAPQGEVIRDLSNATAAYMTDFLRALERLRKRDRAADARGLPRSIPVLAQLAMEDALRDALFYERTILNRSR